MNKKQLFENIKRKKSFLCIGLDTDMEKIPSHLKQEEDPIFAFNKAIIDATADLCVAYKPNLAFYESLGMQGWAAFEKTVNYIRARISSFRKGLLGSKIEVSDDREFSSGRTLITIDELGNEDIFDSTVTVNRPYRYVRFVFDEQKEGNLAEIEFYGKKRGTNVEVLLTGGFSGEPIKQTKTNWTMALDRSFDTYFKKNKGEKGNICLDLGKDNSYEITRVRYVPQTDSNFIVPGNQYRLEYWDNSSWKFFGEQIATDFSLNFSNVPTGRLYILHNLTNGVEERIFTYEDGKQVWW